MLFKDSDIPWIDPCGAQKYTTSHLERTVDSLDLRRCLWTAWREPIHTVHHDTNGERLGLHASKHLCQLISMDPDVVQCTWF